MLPYQGTAQPETFNAMPDATAQTSAPHERTRVSAPRIALFGGFGIGNFGNDASLEALLGFMRGEHPDAELTCICTNPPGLPDHIKIPAIRLTIAPRGWVGKLNKLFLRVPGAIASWMHSFRALGRFDTILVAGTGVFDDFRDSPFGWPSRLLRWTFASRLRGVRFAFVSVGAGPIISPISRLLMKNAALLAEHRSYRDADSHQFMQGIGVDRPGDIVLPDLAFLLPASPDARRDAGKLTVGVGMMNYRGWRDSDAVYQSYLDLHVRLIQWLETQGHEARLIIGQTPTDLIAARDVEARIGRKMIGAREEGMKSIHDAMATIAETDLVIASRYHVQIAALKMGRPLISLSYGPKNEALMADVGLDGFSQDITHDPGNVDFELLTQQFTKLVAERERYAAIVQERVAGMVARLRAALKNLDLAATR
jgi:polysaccharide pyruvyl transferase WcaK-like protein